MACSARTPARSPHREQDDDGSDCHRLRDLAKQSGHDCRRNQDQHHRAGNLFPKYLERRFAAALAQLIRAVLRQPPGSLPGLKAGIERRAGLPHDLGQFGMCQ
jgi:hypothetical protein